MNIIALVLTLLASTPAFAVETAGTPKRTYTVVHQLVDAEGAAVRGHLIEFHGRLYGLAGEAGPNGLESCYSNANWDTDAHNKRCPGSLFSMAVDGSDFRVEYPFSPLDDNFRNDGGYHPYGSLSVSPSGRLWGVTQGGGRSPGCSETTRGAGVVFSYDPIRQDFRIEHQFCSKAGAADGKAPMGEVAFFGDTAFGTAKGNADSQVLWWISATGFANLPASTQYGWSDLGGLTATPAALVGMTNKGDVNGLGAYFTLDPATKRVTRVWPFPAVNVASPINNQDTPAIQVPTRSTRGSIMAAKQLGGANNTGMIVDLGRQKVLKSFDGVNLTAKPRFSNNTGAMPNGHLAEGPDRLLYGTTMYGGVNATGVIYRIARDGVGFEVLHHFEPTDSTDPSQSHNRSYGGLQLASNGNFYGATWHGKALFEFTPPPALPDVRGDTVENASRVLAAAGLTVGQITTTDAVCKGIVFSQNPSPGPAVKAGVAINLMVGRLMLPACL